MLTFYLSSMSAFSCFIAEVEQGTKNRKGTGKTSVRCSWDVLILELSHISAEDVQPDYCHTA